MKIISFLFGSIILSAMPVVAQSQAPVVVSPHLYAFKSGGRLSFLFGTRHSKIELSQLPNFVFKAFHSRSTIAKELVATLEDGSPIPSTQSGTSKPEPDLPPPSALAAEALRVRGVPDYLFTSPWICTFYYTWEPGDVLTMDPAFEALARKHNKIVEGLDAIEDLEKISESAQQSNTICDIESATKYVPPQELIAKDLETLRKYFAGDLSLIEPCDNHCTERTLKWVPKIERLHSEKGVFALVGVGHLGGPGGLIEILRSRGHRVVQVRSARQLDELLAKEKRN